MGQIEDLRMYIAVVDNGGIARAAEKMNLVKSAVSRRLSQMEERYGVCLIERRPRVWEVTSAGQELYQRASSMVADANDLDADFVHSSHNLRGPLTVSVAREFGMSFLKPMLFEFANANPEIDLTIDFDDRTVDLQRENYDLAVRITTSRLDGLTEHRLGSTQHGLFVSPAYANTNGLPMTLQEVTQHPLLHYGSARRARWDFQVNGKKQFIQFQPALNSNSGDFLVEAAVNDMGIIRLPDFVVAPFIAQGKLVQILPDLQVETFGIYLVHASNRRLNYRMRTLMDALKTHCSRLN